MNSNAKRPTGTTDIWAALMYFTTLLVFALGFLAGMAVTAHAEDIIVCTKPSGVMYRIGPAFKKQTCGQRDVENIIALSPPRTTGTMTFAMRPPAPFETIYDGSRVLAMGMTSAGSLAGYVEGQGWLLDAAQVPVAPEEVVSWDATIILDSRGDVWLATDGIGRSWENLGQPASPYGK